MKNIEFEDLIDKCIRENLVLVSRGRYVQYCTSLKEDADISLIYIVECWSEKLEVL